MPTSTAGNSGRNRERGFTLIEVMAVMAILAVAGVVVTLGISSRRSGPEGAEAAAHALASRLRSARDAAIRQAGEEVVLIDATRRLFASRGAARPFTVSAEVRIDVLASRSEQAAPGVIGIRFFPNGASTGGVVRLIENARSYEVRVNWLTGRVVIAPL